VNPSKPVLVISDKSSRIILCRFPVPEYCKRQFIYLRYIPITPKGKIYEVRNEVCWSEEGMPDIIYLDVF
jgi:hypothetical protein